MDGFRQKKDWWEIIYSEQEIDVHLRYVVAK